MTLSGASLDARQMDELVGELAAQGWAGPVDLSAVAFVDPYSCALLFSIVRSMKTRSVHERVPAVEMPVSPEATSYMERIGLLRMLAPMCGRENLGLGVERHPRNTELLMELAAIRAEEDVIEVLRGLSRILKEALGYTAAHCSRICTIVSELCQNIPQHSGDWGVVCAQVYRAGRRRVKIGVSDVGLGIRASLQSVLGPDTGDAEAIRAALRVGVSRYEEAGRGLGLGRVREVVTEAGGRLDVRSGGCRVHLSGQGALYSFGVRHLAGTHVGIELPE